MNPFSPPKDPNVGLIPARRPFALRLASLRFQALLCFVAAGLALLTARGMFWSLSGTVVVLGIGCGVQCLWRDAKRRDRPLGARRLR